MISSNNFTGPLPETLAKLTNLKDLYAVGIAITTSLEKYPILFKTGPSSKKCKAMQASGLERPIPSGISLWPKMSDMRISDLNGTEAAFPPLSSMKNMKALCVVCLYVSYIVPKI
ncbi:hypothetical protein IFM89_019395 [Coptis chinensis]|uniref:Uncharacterized protein n=1 Tax=Coptis chinensis TaxID=261450 RepID=A0A835MBV6_9MAGN|nr:hypothetical protein IFM89_019395 [Coptis chinensis]